MLETFGPYQIKWVEKPVSLFSFSDRCSACELEADFIIHWSKCVNGMQIYIHLNMCFSPSNQSKHLLRAQQPICYIQILCIQPAICRRILPAFFFFYSVSLFSYSFKCRTILKFLHQVIGVSWEQEKRLLILFNFPRVQCLRIALKHMAACLCIY